MEENSISDDYYEVLHCQRTATLEELKKSYQRLVLSSHPDKCGTEQQFLLIQRAWSVLRDPESRKHYDATLTCHEHSDHLLYDSIRLSDMVRSETHDFYTYNCRCGGVYLLDERDCISDKVVIGCDECSFSIEVNR